MCERGTNGRPAPSGRYLFASGPQSSDACLSVCERSSHRVEGGWDSCTLRWGQALAPTSMPL
eukprot:scaffold274513_cov33-Tisochrysis_lutea.AAC.3